MDARILVVGRPESLPVSWVDGLTASGATVSVFAGGDEALRVLDVIRPDLVVLDVHLKGHVDGFDVCRDIRTRSDVLVVFASADPTSVDELVALAVGADGFFSGALALPVVLAHLSSLLRRARGGLTLGAPVEAVTGPGARSPDVPDAPSRIVDADLEIDLVAREVRVDGALTQLTRIEFDLLVTLARDPRRVVLREQLMANVWDRDDTSDHALDAHLSRLRGKVRAAGGQRIAHAVRGVGFRLRS